MTTKEAAKKAFGTEWSNGGTKWIIIVGIAMLIMAIAGKIKFP